MINVDFYSVLFMHVNWTHIHWVWILKLFDIWTESTGWSVWRTKRKFTLFDRSLSQVNQLLDFLKQSEYQQQQQYSGFR